MCILLFPTNYPLSCLALPVLEQLPLSLHRAFTLIQELDEQAQGLAPLAPTAFHLTTHRTLF